MLNSIIATMIARVIGAAALSSSIIQPHSNSYVHRDIFVAQHDELLRRVLLAQKPLARRIQQVEANCTGTPFLWKIIDDATGDHVGFGLGTMHLPSDVVTTEEAFSSIISAVDDSCDVYGELNFYDNNTMNELIDCLASSVGESAGESFSLADIPDEGLREEVHAKIVEIILEYYDSNITNAEIIASGFDDAPFSSIQEFIAYANTPAYMEKHADALFSGVDPKFLDFEILALGRPAGGLEDVSAQCDGTPANSSAEALNQTYASDPDAFASIVRDSLNQSYSTIFELYKCGDMDGIASELNSDDGLELLLNGRNEQMAAKINEVLSASDSNKKILFAVGLAHWLLGNNTMISLLKDYGFSMEHIPYWNSTQLDNPSNEYCGVVYNSEAGIFVEDSAIGNTTSETVPAPSSEGVTSSTPTKMPSQEAEMETAPAPPTTPEPAASASCTLIGMITMMTVWVSYMFYY